MHNMSKASLITIFLFFEIAFISKSAYAEETKSGLGAPTYNYLDAANWGKIDPKFNMCSSGLLQSPINIETKKVLFRTLAEDVNVVYQIDKATLKTNGLAAELWVTGKSEVTLGGKMTFQLVNLRWHTPSEHTVDGVKFMAEMHQVFITKEGDFGLIIATLYEEGEPNPIVAALQPEMAKLAKEMSTGNEVLDLEEEVPNFSADLLRPTPDLKCIDYLGSLTTPPCTQGVIWLLPKAESMTKEQVLQINQLQGKDNKNNARPLQPLSKRAINSNAKI